MKKIGRRSWPAVLARGKFCEQKEVRRLTSGTSAAFYELAQDETVAVGEIKT